MLVLDWPVLSERRDSFPPRPSFLSRFSVLKNSRDKGRSGARRVEERGEEEMRCEAREVWSGVRLGVRVGCNGQWGGAHGEYGRNIATSLNTIAQHHFNIATLYPMRKNTTRAAPT